jgi:hypothetical protein
LRISLRTSGDKQQRDDLAGPTNEPEVSRLGRPMLGRLQGLVDRK